MRKFTALTYIAIVSALLVFCATPLTACNLSNLANCGVYQTPLLNASFPSDSMICLTLCTGYGRTGVVAGADNATRTIAFAWYTHRPGPFEIRTYTPASITSGRGFANCTMTGVNIGPQGPPFNSEGAVMYIDPGYYGTPPCVTQPYGCITSTALCGNVSSQCITYRFQVNKIPDSVRVFGVEGNGNPSAGCFPNTDMMIDFTTIFFPVKWGELEAITAGSTIHLSWSTLSEENSDLFMVERATNGSDFTEIGTLAAAGYSSKELNYGFADLAPMPGANFYRIAQLDKDGNLDYSQTIEVIFESPTGFAWGAFGPNPATDYVDLTYYDDRKEEIALSVYDLQGRTVTRQVLESGTGANSVRLSIGHLDAGCYYVTVQGEGGKLSRKVVKQ